ncbi:hypothetical protein [Ralstonia solanacearum]|uniref:hypothetical protein n=1 Tax=Ralstonia solanacearum TaxID=305 RepID=UPI0019D3F302|nr:hypothetical protein [Ralstonia solanacearum]
MMVFMLNESWQFNAVDLEIRVYGVHRTRRDIGWISYPARFANGLMSRRIVQSCARHSIRSSRRIRWLFRLNIFAGNRPWTQGRAIPFMPFSDKTKFAVCPRMQTLGMEGLTATAYQ